MDAKSIQQILEEQRKQAAIFNKTEHQINTTISARNRDVSHYKGSLTDPVIRKDIESKRRDGVEKAKLEGKFSKAQKKRYENPEERKKTSEASILASKNPETKKRKSESSKKTWSNKNLRERVSKSHIKQWEDPEKRKKLSDTMKSIRKYPIMTPDGPFEDSRAAGEYYKCTRDNILYRRKKYPEQYYYITKEEYIMLTGKDL